MANKKLIQGILGALDEKLGTKLFKNEGVSLANSGVKIIEQSRVPGILARPPEPTIVHPDILSGTDPLYDVYHGTNRRVNYNQPGAGFHDDVGLHVTSSPEVSDYYALNWDTPDTNLLSAEHSGKIPGLSLAGPRSYPLLMDPGKVMDFPGDAYKWTPENINDSVKEALSGGYQEVSPEAEELARMVTGGKGVESAIKELGFDTLKYPHVNPHEWIASEDAYLLTDPSRVVPKYSTTGQQAAKVRGILAGDKGFVGDTEDMLAELGPLGIARDSPDEFIKDLWNPTPRQLRDEIKKLDLEIRYGNFPPKTKAGLEKTIEKLRSHVVGTDNVDQKVMEEAFGVNALLNRGLSKDQIFDKYQKYSAKAMDESFMKNPKYKKMKADLKAKGLMP